MKVGGCIGVTGRLTAPLGCNSDMPTVGRDLVGERGGLEYTRDIGGPEAKIPASERYGDSRCIQGLRRNALSGCK